MRQSQCAILASIVVLAADSEKLFYSRYCFLCGFLLKTEHLNRCRVKKRAREALRARYPDLDCEAKRKSNPKG
jgi:hypothetical protein